MQHSANANIEDLDSNTPFELYFSHSDNELAKLSPTILRQFTPAKDLVKAQDRRKQILVERKKHKKMQLREYISSRYIPKYPEIFSGTLPSPILCKV
jgi:hypothetical protein